MRRKARAPRLCECWRVAQIERAECKQLQPAVGYVSVWTMGCVSILPQNGGGGSWRGIKLGRFGGKSGETDPAHTVHSIPTTAMTSNLTHRFADPNFKFELPSSTPLKGRVALVTGATRGIGMPARRPCPTSR